MNTLLLQQTPITYYWVGFLLADGHFKDARLSVHLAVKDDAHLKQFLNYVGEPQSYHYRDIKLKGKLFPQICAAFSNPIVKKVAKKFSISSRKTYEPPNISWIKDNLFWSLLIGFIDGDGSIRHQTGRKDCFITIKIHSSWLSILQLMGDRLYGQFNLSAPHATLNNKGYAVINFTNSIILKFLKRKALRLRLPLLERKWSRIDLKYVSKMETATLRRKQILQLLREGQRSVDICRKLAIHSSMVTQAVKAIGYQNIKSFVSGIPLPIILG